MTEIEINRANHLIDPLHIWGWEVPFYLFLGGITAGLMIFSALLAWKVPRAERSAWARWLPFGAPIMLSLGMLALFMDLEFKQHVYRFYLAFVVTSPMSWGSWILLAIYPATLLMGLAGLTEQELQSLERWGPVKALGLGRMMRCARAQVDDDRAAEILRWSNLILGVALGGYTGLLLGTMGARAAWSSSIMGPLFLVSGFSTGAALIMLFPVTDKEHHLLRRWDVGAITLELILLGLFIMGLATGNAASAEASQLFLGGPFTALFWSLVVFAGLLIPLIIESVEALRKYPPAYVAPVLLLVGGLSLRWILVMAGQA